MTKPEDRARRTAYDVLLAVDQQSAFANLLLPRLLRERGLTTTDAAFATELTYGALRWQGVLDDVIGSAASRDVRSLDPEVRAVARLGAYQLLRMRVPAHAAVHSSVELAKLVAGHRVVGFVNAVLRAVGRRDWDAWAATLAPTDAVGALAFGAGHPRWVAEAFLDALDGDMGELADALAEDRPVTHLVARPGRITRDDLLAGIPSDLDAASGPWSPFAVRLPGGGDPGGIAAVRDGRAAVQDEGSQLAAIALSRADVAGAERWWADVCAGPGGKAALLQGLATDGVGLVAGELQPHRAALVRDAVGGAPASTGRTHVLVADGRRPPWREQSFDRVLVDAPCTGLGALRRRPEVRWRRQATDVERLHELQVELLSAALDATRPGGVVAYVTCSPHRRETRDVVERVVGPRPDARVEDARPCFDGVPDLGDGPDVQLWPHRHGTDAMYVALIRLVPT